MKIEELIAGLKEKGLSDEAIKAELEKIKADIDAFLTPAETPAETNDEDEVETDEDKKHRIFGI